MTRDEYLGNRNSNNISSEHLFETLLLNPTFKIKDFNIFNQMLEIMFQSPFLRKKVSTILKEEYIRLNDIRFNVTILYDTKKNEIKYY